MEEGGFKRSGYLLSSGDGVEASSVSTCSVCGSGSVEEPHRKLGCRMPLTKSSVSVHRRTLDPT